MHTSLPTWSIDAPPTRWRQLNLETEDPSRVEPLLIGLAPLLHELGLDGAGLWWIRKGTTVRLRIRQRAADTSRPAFESGVEDATDRVIAATCQLGACVYPGLYEPEIHAFGGQSGIDLAHEFACQDAWHLAGHLAQNRTHSYRHEVFLLLATRLMRAAGLDLDEQGDVWARVAAHRPAPDTVSVSTGRAVRHLIFSGPDTTSSPLAQTPRWCESAQNAGRTLAAAAATGRLTRGQRAVTANLLLFLANRHGVGSAHLAVLSTAAHHVIFQEDHHVIPTSDTTDDTADHVRSPDVDAATLRNQLADIVRARRGFSAPYSAVERAFRTVSRHEFVPDTPLEQAYAPRPVVTKRAANGTALSSASAPTLVARMLEQLAARPGERILEIGAATGFNAALLAELVGPTGRVVTIEYDQDLADGATDAITRTGYTERVEVRCGDGADGAPDRAPFDAIIVTAGAVAVPDIWWDQLTEDGRMIVPLQLHPSGLTRSLRLRCTGPGIAVSTQQVVCGFVPMRGQAATDHHRVAESTRLADDILLDHAATDDHHTAGLAQALATPPSWQQWTGLTIATTPASTLHLDLWLATQQPAQQRIPFGQLSVSRAVRDAGITDPSLRWSGATLFHAGSAAYLVTRDTGTDTDEEIGITAHGPDAHQLGTALLELTATWHAGPRQHEPTISVSRGSDPVVQW